jgi:hypothetical protein
MTTAGRVRRENMSMTSQGGGAVRRAMTKIRRPLLLPHRPSTSSPPPARPLGIRSAWRRPGSLPRFPAPGSLAPAREQKLPPRPPPTAVYLPRALEAFVPIGTRFGGSPGKGPHRTTAGGSTTELGDRAPPFSSLSGIYSRVDQVIEITRLTDRPDGQKASSNTRCAFSRTASFLCAS